MPGFERPMILSTMRWFSGARLGHALAAAGFVVSACHPRGHPLELVEGVRSHHRLNRFRPLDSLLAAVRQAGPDLIVPDDERSLQLLRLLHGRVSQLEPPLAALLVRSLGAPGDWPALTSRAALADVANQLGVPCPNTSRIDTLAALLSWVQLNGLPVVLKTDGSWGGRGVVIISDEAALPKAWQAISRAPTLIRSLKRSLVNLEFGVMAAWLRHRPPTVNAQRYVAGRGGIVTAASLNGEVKAIVCLEVIHTNQARGPAAIVRVIDDPGMASTARGIISRFGLSGFSGFDFMLAEDGTAQLLELNARATPTCHLLIEGGIEPGRTLALFPDEPESADARVTSGALLDVPTSSPALERKGRELARKSRQPARAAARRLTHWASTRWP